MNRELVNREQRLRYKARKKGYTSKKANGISITIHTVTNLIQAIVLVD